MKMIRESNMKKFKLLLEEDILFYNGFDKPVILDLDDFVLNSNYLGDITELFFEELNHLLEHYEISEIIEDQPLSMDFNVWITPNFSQLSEYNLMIGLDAEDYLKDYIF